MKPLAIVGGSSADREALVERLAERLADGGRVGVVTASDGATGDDRPTDDRPADDRSPDRPSGVAVRYDVSEAGWTATADGAGSDRPPVAAALDRLAPDCDYALVAGAPDAALARVVLGDRADDGDRDSGDHDRPVLAAAADPAAVDLDAVVEGLRDVEPHETLESLVARAKTSSDADRAGAVATFTGRVRARDGADDPATEYLEFEKYDGVADERMAAIREDLEARDGVFEVLLHHRTGVVTAGEDIVFVVVLAGHRAEAFRTVEDGIDRLKAEVPLFKKEVTVDEEFWVHDRS